MNTPFHLNGRTILVTGASSGIGRGIAIAVSQMGGHVVLSGRNEARLHETLGLLSGEGHHVIAGDLTVAEKREALVACCPGLDGVVHCAGVALLRPFKFTDDERLKEIFNINFDAPFKLTRDLLKKKKINRGASMVFISSIGCIVGSPGLTVYSATKGAINGLTRTLSKELISAGIRVNAISPGMVKTDFVDGLVNAVSTELTDIDIARYPLGYGEPEDVANATVFLLSSASKWITGINLVTDGGRL